MGRISSPDDIIATVRVEGGLVRVACALSRRSPPNCIALSSSMASLPSCLGPLTHASLPTQMLPQTYSPMPTYRTCTTDGLTTLSEGLERRLLEELRRGAR